MTTHSVDTIFALSSGALPAGVAVVRVSGPHAMTVCSALAGAVPSPHKASLRSIRRRNGELLDQALVLVFPAPRSFTGEDCVEFQLHGSRAVIAALYEELKSLGCRLAEAGEFSRRAFEGGKLDLAEIEGLADLITAETEMQRRLAIEESFGQQTQVYASWRERILHARAMLEAELDFGDEEDVPGSVSQPVLSDLRQLRADMQRHVDLQEVGEIIRDGFKVVIAGPPNSGKSSLLNALAGSDLAIVTDIPGTTRDVLHVDLDLGGYLVKLYDTAGLRDASDPVERIGITRARAKVAEADLVLLLHDANGAEPETYMTFAAPVLRIASKADLSEQTLDATSTLKLSTVTGLGLDELRIEILRQIEVRTSAARQAVPSRLRHIGHITDAISRLQDLEKWDIGQAELLAETLRLASDALARISGRIDTEEILGVIFSSFCIGK